MTPVETLKTIYGHMRTGEWEKIDPYLADDFTVYQAESLPFGGEWRGDNVFKRLFAAVMGNFEDPKVEPIDMSCGDEWVCYALHLSGTSKATGKRSTYRVIEHGRVVDGKLMELHLHYFDTARIVKDIEGNS